MKFIVFLLFFISPISFAQELKITNNIEGDGLQVIKHSKIKVHYLGKLENGKKFDSSYDRGDPLSFQIGMRQVIEGWEQGLLGMKVGGKRTLIIPPKLAYGERGVGDLIPSNATLIFEVEIIDIQLPGYFLVMTKDILRLQKENYQFIDIRTKEERNNTGIIPGSIEITAFDIYGNFVPDFMKNFQNLVDLNNNVVLISNEGEISSILANGFVEQLGAKYMYSLKGGIQQLIKDNFNLFKN